MCISQHCRIHQENTHKIYNPDFKYNYILHETIEHFSSGQSTTYIKVPYPTYIQVPYQRNSPITDVIHFLILYDEHCHREYNVRYHNL